MTRIERNKNKYWQEFILTDEGRTQYKEDFILFLCKKIMTLNKPCPECEKIRNLIHNSNNIDMGAYTHVDTDSWEKIEEWVYG
jgi:hypothetical protein